jgi:hypothetical protein
MCICSSASPSSAEERCEGLVFRKPRPLDLSSSSPHMVWRTALLQEEAVIPREGRVSSRQGSSIHHWRFGILGRPPFAGDDGLDSIFKPARSFAATPSRSRRAFSPQRCERPASRCGSSIRNGCAASPGWRLRIRLLPVSGGAIRRNRCGRGALRPTVRASAPRPGRPSIGPQGRSRPHAGRRPPSDSGR